MPDTVDGRVDAVERVARALVANDGGIEATLELVVAGVHAAVPSIAHVAVTLTADERAAGDEVALGLARLGEGPGHDAVARRGRVLVDDVALSAGGWPLFAPAAAEAGVRTVCALPLAGRHDRVVGTLILAAGTAGALAGPACDAAALVAAYAAVAIDRARRIDELETALRSRDVIATAKGILVERFAVGPDEAFAMLRRSSQHTNLKLRDVAEWVVGDTAGSRPPESGHNGVPDGVG